MRNNRTSQKAMQIDMFTALIITDVDQIHKIMCLLRDQLAFKTLFYC